MYIYYIPTLDYSSVTRSIFNLLYEFDQGKHMNFSVPGISPREFQDLRSRTAELLKAHNELSREALELSTSQLIVRYLERRG